MSLVIAPAFTGRADVAAGSDTGVNGEIEVEPQQPTHPMQKLESDSDVRVHCDIPKRHSRFP